MKKNQAIYKNAFDALEFKIINKYKNGRPLNEKELRVQKKLKTSRMTPWREKVLNHLNETSMFVEPGKKYPLMARDAKRQRNPEGRRFVYLGIDGELHIGRYGKPLKIAMK